MILKIPDQLSQLIAIELSQVVAADLFTNGNGDTAERLILELAEGEDGGGWSREAATKRIAFIIQKWLCRTE